MELLLIIIGGLVAVAILRRPQSTYGPGAVEAIPRMPQRSALSDLWVSLQEVDEACDLVESKLREHPEATESTPESRKALKALAIGLETLRFTTEKLATALRSLGSGTEPQILEFSHRLLLRILQLQTDASELVSQGLSPLTESLPWSEDVHVSFIVPPSRKIKVKMIRDAPFYAATNCGSCGATLSSKYICSNCTPLSD